MHTHIASLQQQSVITTTNLQTSQGENRFDIDASLYSTTQNIENDRLSGSGHYAPSSRGRKAPKITTNRNMNVTCINTVRMDSRDAMRYSIGDVFDSMDVKSKAIAKNIILPPIMSPKVQSPTRDANSSIRVKGVPLRRGTFKSIQDPFEDAKYTGQR